MRVYVLLFLFTFSVPVQCQSKTQEKCGQINSLYLLVKVVCFLLRNLFIFCQFCIRAFGSRRIYQQCGPPLLCWSLPSISQQHLLHPRPASTKSWTQPLPPVRGKAGGMRGVAELWRRKIVHRLDKRKHQLDAPAHFKVILLHLLR